MEKAVTKCLEWSFKGTYTLLKVPTKIAGKIVWEFVKVPPRVTWSAVKIPVKLGSKLVLHMLKTPVKKITPKFIKKNNQRTNQRRRTQGVEEETKKNGEAPEFEAKCT